MLKHSHNKDTVCTYKAARRQTHKAVVVKYRHCTRSWGRLFIFGVIGQKLHNNLSACRNSGGLKEHYTKPVLALYSDIKKMKMMGAFHQSWIISECTCMYWLLYGALLHVRRQCCELIFPHCCCLLCSFLIKPSDLEITAHSYISTNTTTKLELLLHHLIQAVQLWRRSFYTRSLSWETSAIIDERGCTRVSSLIAPRW